MEERTVQSLHDGNLDIISLIRLAGADFLVNLIALGALGVAGVVDLTLAGLDISSALVDTVAVVESHIPLSFGRGTLGSSKLSNAEDRLPPMEFLFFWRRKSKSGGSQSPFGPSIVNASEMPLYLIGLRVAVKLVAYVDQILHGCEIDEIDGGEVENDSLEVRSLVVRINLLALSWAGVIPRTVSQAWV